MTSHRVSRRTFPRRGCPAGAGDHQRQRQPPVEHAPPVIGQVEHEHEPEHPVPLLRQAPYPLPVRTVQLEHARRQLAPAARTSVGLDRGREETVPDVEHRPRPRPAPSAAVPPQRAEHLAVRLEDVEDAETAKRPALLDP
jgi:hypothetical protein